MPELPEVTTVIGILKNEVVGKTFDSIDILYKNIIKSDPLEFQEKLINNTILDITRLGKFIIFHLSNDLILISHLRMEGKYSLLDKNDALPKHSCVVFNFKDNSKLVYHDTRKFGVLILTSKEKFMSEPPLSKLGPEPMSLNTIESKLEVCKKLNKKKCIKELLLDQSIMAGIGNIYADEILFLSRINPFTLGSELSEDQCLLIIENSVKILEKAIELGGSTIKSYHPKEGVSGLFQIELKVYGKKGQPCPICGTKLKKTFINGRGTTYCPNCQIDHSLQKGIAISGSIGAGKSTVLKIFEELGYKIISSDETVAEFYKTEEAKKILVKKFGDKILDENREINKQFLRNEIQNNEVLQGFLENLVFPYVENEIISAIKKYEKLIVEVPLLEKAHLQYLFKSIIYVDADKNIREKRISESRPYNAKKAIELFEKNNPRKIKFSKNSSKSLQNLNIFPKYHFLENNFSSVEELKNEIISNLINKL